LPEWSKFQHCFFQVGTAGRFGFSGFLSLHFIVVNTGDDICFARLSSLECCFGGTKDDEEELNSNERDVDVEHVPPTKLGGDRACNQRSDGIQAGEVKVEEGNAEASLVDKVEFTNYGDEQTLVRTSTEPLDHPSGQ
jgi:hypothetical protein